MEALAYPGLPGQVTGPFSKRVSGNPLSMPIMPLK